MRSVQSCALMALAFVSMFCLVAGTVADDATEVAKARATAAVAVAKATHAVKSGTYSSLKNCPCEECDCPECHCAGDLAAARLKATAEIKKAKIDIKAALPQPPTLKSTPARTGSVVTNQTATAQCRYVWDGRQWLTVCPQK